MNNRLSPLVTFPQNELHSEFRLFISSPFSLVVCLSINISFYLSVCQFMVLTVYPSVSLQISLSVCLTFLLAICQSSCCLSFDLSCCLTLLLSSVCPSSFLAIYLSVSRLALHLAINCSSCPSVFKHTYLYVGLSHFLAVCLSAFLSCS